jgi:hypothetical protein
MSWEEISDGHYMRSTGRLALIIEDKEGCWRWKVVGPNFSICDDDTGEYARTKKQAKFYAELNALNNALDS